MLWTIEPGTEVTRGYLYFPNNVIVRLLQDCNKEIWIYARDIYRAMGADENNFLRTLVEIDPDQRALLPPETCNEKTWVNLVTIDGAIALAELASREDQANLVRFMNDFAGAYSNKLLWEQSLFEEEKDEQKCAAGV